MAHIKEQGTPERETAADQSSHGFSLEHAEPTTTHALVQGIEGPHDELTAQPEPNRALGPEDDVSPLKAGDHAFGYSPQHTGDLEHLQGVGSDHSHSFAGAFDAVLNTTDDDMSLGSYSLYQPHSSLLVPLPEYQHATNVYSAHGASPMGASTGPYYQGYNAIPESFWANGSGPSASSHRAVGSSFGTQFGNAYQSRQLSDYGIASQAGQLFPGANVPSFNNEGLDGAHQSSGNISPHSAYHSAYGSGSNNQSPSRPSFYGTHNPQRQDRGLPAVPELPPLGPQGRPDAVLRSQPVRDFPEPLRNGGGNSEGDGSTANGPDDAGEEVARAIPRQPLNQGRGFIFHSLQNWSATRHHLYNTVHDHYSTQYKDSTLPSTASEERNYVQQMWDAYMDPAMATDNIGIINSWRTRCSEDRSHIEDTLWQILERLVAYHSKPGFLVVRKRYPLHTHKYTNFQFHVKLICEGFRKSKTVCNHVLGAPYIDILIDDPEGATRRIESNRRVNDSKKAKAQLGKDAVKRLKEQTAQRPTEPAQASPRRNANAPTAESTRSLGIRRTTAARRIDSDDNDEEITHPRKRTRRSEPEDDDFEPSPSKKRARK